MDVNDVEEQIPKDGLMSLGRELTQAKIAYVPWDNQAMIALFTNKDKTPKDHYSSKHYQRTSESHDFTKLLCLSNVWDKFVVCFGNSNMTNCTEIFKNLIIIDLDFKKGTHTPRHTQNKRQLHLTKGKELEKKFKCRG